MGEEIKEVARDWMHRLGDPKDDKVRPITDKFARYNTRTRVFRNYEKCFLSHLKSSSFSRYLNVCISVIPYFFSSQPLL